MLNYLISAAGEKVVNRYINLDTDVVSKLKPIQNKIIKFEISKPLIEVFIKISKDSLEFSPEMDQPVDVILRTDSFSLLKQFMMKLSNKSLVDEQIQISGDPHVLQVFMGVIEKVDIDWEEHLSQILGDVMARPVAILIRRTLRKMQDLKDTFLLNFTEYVQEEKGLTPPALENNDFSQDVAKLRDDVERLECRIQRIEKIKNYEI